MTNLTTRTPFWLEMRRDPDIQTPVHVAAVVVTIVLEVVALILLVVGGGKPGAQALACAIFGLMYASFSASGSYLGEWYRVAYQVAIEEGVFLGACLALIDFAMSIVPWKDVVFANRFWQFSRVTALIIFGASFAGYVAIMAFGRGDLVLIANTFKSTPGSLAMLALAGFAFIWSADSARDPAYSQERRGIVVAGVVALLLSLQYLYSVIDQAPTGVFPDAFLIVVLACNFLGAVGLAYAILFGPFAYVISQTVTFSLVSGAVGLVFFAIEGIGHKLLENQARAENLAVTVAAAIVVGLSIRPLHAYIDRAVDEFFFGKRHRAVRRLVSFAHQAFVYGSANELLSASEKAIKKHGRTESCTILLADQTGALCIWGGDPLERSLDLTAASPVPEALRSNHVPIRRDAVPAMDFADLALPLFAGKRPIGLIACNHPRHGDPYSTEEIDALWELARAVAANLVAIEADMAQDKLTILSASASLGAAPGTSLGTT